MSVGRRILERAAELAPPPRPHLDHAALVEAMMPAARERVAAERREAERVTAQRVAAAERLRRLLSSTPDEDRRAAGARRRVDDMLDREFARRERQAGRR